MFLECVLMFTILTGYPQIHFTYLERWDCIWIKMNAHIGSFKYEIRDWLLEYQPISSAHVNKFNYLFEQPHFKCKFQHSENVVCNLTYVSRVGYISRQNVYEDLIILFYILPFVFSVVFHFSQSSFFYHMMKVCLFAAYL